MAYFKMSLLFIIFLVLIQLTTTICCFNVENSTLNSFKDDAYQESLFIKPLIDGKLLAQFQFTTNYQKSIKDLRWENKLRFFPLSLADLVLTADLNELYFSLTKGNWNHRNWGYLNTPSPPGAQIRVKFSQHNHDPERSWNRLVNSLAGKFCASLASADKKTLVYSKFIFSSFYSSLPEETLCTENITPWKKSLPCSNSGLASLLNAVNLLKSSYSHISMHLKPISDESVQLTHSISVVFNPLHLFEGKQVWSLIKIFGKPIQRVCNLATESLVHVDISSLDDKTKLYPDSNVENLIDGRTIATFDVKRLVDPSKGQQLNLGVKQTKIFKQPAHSSKPMSPIHFTTHIVGVGAGDGSIVGTVTNNLDEPIRITYLHVIPHFLPVYLHTLAIKTKTGQELKPDKLNYNLSKENSPTLIEFSVILPPENEIQISYDFERAFLRWTEYRPDAHKGILLASAMIDVAVNNSVARQYLVVPPTDSLNSDKLQGDRSIRIFARPLLIILPTPDFSMPYNVICLVSSVLVAAFAPIYCMTTNKPMIMLQKESSDKKRESNKESKKEK